MTQATMQLNQAALGQLPSGIPGPAYDRGAVARSIVHIGVGGFYRAHQALYLDDLLQLPGPGHQQWGYCGVGLLACCIGIGLGALGGHAGLVGFGGARFQAHFVTLAAGLGHVGFGLALLGHLLCHSDFLLGEIGQLVDVGQAFFLGGSSVGAVQRIGSGLEFHRCVGGNCRVALGGNEVAARAIELAGGDRCAAASRQDNRYGNGGRQDTQFGHQFHVGLRFY